LVVSVVSFAVLLFCFFVKKRNTGETPVLPRTILAAGDNMFAAAFGELK